MDQKVPWPEAYIPSSGSLSVNTQEGPKQSHLGLLVGYGQSMHGPAAPGSLYMPPVHVQALNTYPPWAMAP